MGAVILLDAYAARSCPVKTQHAHDPLVERPATQDDQSAPEWWFDTRGFKDQVLGEVATVLGAVDLRGVEDGQEREVRTLQALAEGAPVVLGPRLPLNLAGHRRGSPDVLVRGTDRADGRPGYLPVQVKKHRILERQIALDPLCWVTHLDDPLLASARAPETQIYRASRELDAIQVAHYWRMLHELELVAPGDPMAGLIGNDEIDDLDGRLGVVWLDLQAKFIRTFSRTSESGWKRRSALERYDHEFGFRLKVAETAAEHHGPDDRLMVAPIVTHECRNCPWWAVCEPALDADDLSKQISKSPLDVREITALRKLGVATVNDLLDVEDFEGLLERYLPEVRHRDGAEERLRLAARRARMIVDGVVLARLSDEPIEVASAELEIDFDIETARNDRIYLWGFLVHDRASGEAPYYKAFARFEDMTTEQEAALAADAMAWLAALVRGRDAKVYHYSDYELIHLRKVAAVSGDPAALELLARDHLFVDLFKSIQLNFFGTQGLGLKVVATEGPGFHWRDPDPSGLASQTWFEEACSDESEEARTAAATRVLEYNEDDVLATHALRGWLRSEHG